MSFGKVLWKVILHHETEKSKFLPKGQHQGKRDIAKKYFSQLLLKVLSLSCNLECWFSYPDAVTIWPKKWKK